jgi:hypothetical protein
MRADVLENYQVLGGENGQMDMGGSTKFGAIDSGTLML